MRVHATDLNTGINQVTSREIKHPPDIRGVRPGSRSSRHSKGIGMIIAPSEQDLLT